ncbi:hypothetical protein D3C85_1335190 [compost metagenome]
MTMLLADWRSDACSTLRNERRLSIGGELPWLWASNAGTVAFLRRLRRHSLSWTSLYGMAASTGRPVWRSTSSGSDRPPNSALRTKAHRMPKIRPMAVATPMMMAPLGRTGLSGCTAASRMRTLPTLPARISFSCWALLSSAV